MTKDEKIEELEAARNHIHCAIGSVVIVHDETCEAFQVLKAALKEINFLIQAEK